jgi:ribokinase
VARVFVLGNAAFDVVLTLPRLPLHGETLIAERAARAPGGKGLNQAVVAARAGVSAGVDVLFCAPLGKDASGDEVAAALVAEPFAQLVLPRLDRPTDMSTVMVLPGAENSIVSTGDCAAAFCEQAAVTFAERAGADDWLLLQGNLSATTTRAAIRAAAANGASVMLNTAPLWWQAEAMLAGCAVVVANRGEALALTGQRAPADAAMWLHRAGARLAIVTVGADGCFTAGSTGARHWPAADVVARDTTGCGDAFCGRLAVALACRAPLDAAIGAAQHAAAIAAGRMGAYASLPTIEALTMAYRHGAGTRGDHTVGISS